MAVNGISEEGPCLTLERLYTATEFQDVLQFAVEHEIGHLLIGQPNDQDWHGGHLRAGAFPNALMEDVPHQPAALAGIACHPAEIRRMNLPSRRSVP